MIELQQSASGGSVRSGTLECVRRIGLAGAALAQLRADYEKKPTPWVRQAILSKIRDLVCLGSALDLEDDR